MDPKGRAKAEAKGKMPEDLAENLAVDEFFSRLNSDMRHPRPGEEALAAVMDAVQRLTTESDVEFDAESAATVDDGPACISCGSSNRPGHRFCSNCGVPLAGAGPMQPQAQPSPPVPEPAAAGPHHYHHHYHHHYFENGGPGMPGHARGNTAPVREIGRPEIGRPRIASGGVTLSRAEAAANRVMEDWVLSCNTKHLDDLLSLYIADATVLRPNVPPVRGAGPIREFFVAALGTGFGEVEMEPVRLEVLGDVAYQAGRCKSLVPSVGGKRREERGKYLVVLARQGSGDWKIVSDCWSSDLSLPGTEPGANTPSRETRRG